jgi:hypothetical protein
MKKILIIAPHYPPSNLAAVHRTRLFAQHLPKLGWEPVILVVHENYYEEELDWNLRKLLPKHQKIEKVKAFRVTNPRFIGDIGLRAFFQLRKKALRLVLDQNIDFVYIPIPSFYVSLIGPYLNRKTGVRFGVDYIDPWVHQFPGSEKTFSRHWISTQLAKWLEPKALTNVSLITGVSEGYYKGVIERNPTLKNTCVFGAMPYGGEKQDHQAIKGIGLKPYLFKKNNKLQLIYAGAMLPKAYEPLETLFKTISYSPELFKNIEFHFIGTGKTPSDPVGFNIKPYAEKYGIWQKQVFEYPKRIPYLDVLIHLETSDAVFILGSTEPHYTPSKTYQGVLSGKPIFAMLHVESTAATILEETNAGVVFKIYPQTLNQDFSMLQTRFKDFLDFQSRFKTENVNKDQFETYSARSVTEELVKLLNIVTL